MIAVFIDKNETIVVGLNKDGSPIDLDGKLFGPESDRNIETFERFDADTDNGQLVHIVKELPMAVVRP